MISEADRYYGAVIHYVIERWIGPVTIEKMLSAPAGFYLLNQALPIFIKYSTSRFGPWQFNFHAEQQRFQEVAFRDFSECVTVLVCGRDGFPAMSHEQFRTVLDENFEEQEGVSVRRRRKEMYRIKGKDGTLERKVSRNSLAELINSAVASEDSSL